jgi:fructose-1,6-bisphosphatase/inositol monophosphatase family enzyme
MSPSPDRDSPDRDSPDSPDRNFARLLVPGVRRAATIARNLEGRVANRPKSHEESDVKQALTEADTSAQEALLDALYDCFPDVCLSAEEDTPGVARFPRQAASRVVIDPIDGTLHSYLEGSGPYAVMIGLVVDGTYLSGLVALPREGLLFTGSRGAGAFTSRGGGPLRAIRAQADGDRILVSHGMPEPTVAYLQSEGFEVISACGGAVAVAPLIRGVRAGLRVARNDDIGVSIRGRIGCVIAAEAGAIVRGDGGCDFPSDDTTPAATLRVTAREEDQQLLAQALEAH